jgi:hypothetical protein
MASQLRQIAIIHASCQDDGAVRRELDKAATVAEWAAALARHGGAGDASLYIIPEDHLVTGVHPRTLLSPGNFRPSDDFVHFPLAVTVVTALPADADPSTTPLALTRGLDPESGRWKPARGDDGGVYGTDGGWIVFLDGHVQFFSTLWEDGGALARHGDGTPTADIREAIPPGARAINWQGTVWRRSDE